MTTTQHAARLLERRAAHAEVITYTAMAVALGMRTTGLNLANHPLRGVLNHLDAEDKSAERPHRSALVVTKESGLPGLGFFTMLRIDTRRGISTSEKRAIWESQLSELRSFYAANT